MSELRQVFPASREAELSRVLCVTNRHLVADGASLPEAAAGSAGGRELADGAAEDVAHTAGAEDWTPFLRRLEMVVRARPRAVILREKDLPPVAYARLAQEVLALCRAAGVPCLLHTHAALALRLAAAGLHLPLALLRGLPLAQRQRFALLGASCHSVEDVRAAERLGCSYVTLGHIYATACKPGLPPRGRDLLRRACAAARIPVYAIGGITPARLAEVCADGAAGACVMSGLMRGSDWIPGIEKIC